MGHSVGAQVARNAVCFEPSGVAEAMEGIRASAPKRAVWKIIFVDLYVRYLG